MRSSSISFAPLFRAGIGFDNIVDNLQRASRAIDGYPPYDIEQVADDRYRIVVALAGWRQEEIEVVAERGTLTIKGTPPAVPEDAAKRAFLHQGIARRAFVRGFVVENRIEVESAALANGLLTIDLHRVVPEDERPRTVPITVAA